MIFSRGWPIVYVTLTFSIIPIHPSRAAPGIYHVLPLRLFICSSRAHYISQIFEIHPITWRFLNEIYGMSYAINQSVRSCYQTRFKCGKSWS